MLMACEGRLPKLNDLEGVAACPQVVTAAAVGMALQEVVGMAPAQVEGGMVHQVAEGAMGRLQTEGAMGHHHVAMAGL